MKKIDYFFKTSGHMKYLVLILIINFYIFTACNHFQKEKNEKGNIMESKQHELVNEGHDPIQAFYSMDQNCIYVIDQWLYYCDPIRDSGFYAYNLQTNEEILITEQQGIPYETSHGYFYILDKKVYEIKNFDIVLLCELPEDAEFMDAYQNKIYWTARRKFTVDSFEYNVRQYLYSWEINSEETVAKSSSELLYDISFSTTIINDIIILNDSIYIGQSNGLYIIDCKTMEINCVFQEEAFSLYSDGEYVVVKGLDEDGWSYWLYKVLPEDNSVQKIENSETCTFTSIKEGVLYFNYFNNSTGIASYNLKEGGYKILATASGGLISQAYTHVAFFKNYMVLRHGYGYYICLFDMFAKTFERIIPT